MIRSHEAHDGTREDPPGGELDQEWSELVEELRLLVPGVEVLFGFLLVLPFQERFWTLEPEQQYVYFAALLASAIGILLLISPSVNHRLRWREGEKEALLRSATKMSIASTLFTAFAMTASVFLVSELVLGGPATAWVAGLLVGLFGWFWYGLPLWLRFRRARTR